MTRRNSFIVISIIWIISSGYATFRVLPYLKSRGIDITPYGCTNNYMNPLFFAVSAIAVFFVPTVIILVKYTRILFIAHKRRRRAQNGELGRANQVTNRSSSFYQDLKNIRMMAIVLGAIVLCWGPFFTLKLIEIHNDKCFFLLNGFFLVNGFFHEVSRYLIVFILPTFNGVCNPIIYACFDGKYRKAFKGLFNRMCR